MTSSPSTERPSPSTTSSRQWRDPRHRYGPRGSRRLIQPPGSVASGLTSDATPAGVHFLEQVTSHERHRRDTTDIGANGAAASVARLKHPRAIRWLHWINLPLLAVMVWSGLRIYWAEDVYAFGCRELAVVRLLPGGGLRQARPRPAPRTWDGVPLLVRLAVRDQRAGLHDLSGGDAGVAPHPPRPSVAAGGAGRRAARPAPASTKRRRRAATTPPSGWRTPSCW